MKTHKVFLNFGVEIFALEISVYAKILKLISKQFGFKKLSSNLQAKDPIFI